jgi:hypothetical protein
MRIYPLLLSLLLALPALAAWQAVVSPTGAVQLSSGTASIGMLAPGLFERGWQYATLSPVGGKAADGAVQGYIRAPGGGMVDTNVRFAAVGNGARLTYRLTPRTALALNSLHVDMRIPVARVLGGSYEMDGVKSAFPATFDGTVHLRAAPTTSLTLTTAGGATLTYRFATPTPVLVQDDRQWGNDFSLRIGPQFGEAATWPAGKALEIDLTLTAPDGVAISADGPTTVTAGPEWIPLDAETEIVAGSALDFSALVPWHTPAGARGRVLASPDGHFVFAEAPRTPVRFYGVNLCFTGQYLTHEQADVLATRLQRLGYNTVRFHHYESELVDRASSTPALRADQLDKLDYLFAALKARGLYITTDLFVSRPVPAAALYEGATGQMGMDEFKMAVPVNARAYDNFLAFARLLLGHVNPYTKLTWADDPALAWISLVNENNPGNFLGSLSPRVKADWAAAWSTWRAAHGLPAAPWTGKLDTELSRFLADTEAGLMTRVRKTLRDELHCAALLTDCNAWSNPLQMAGARTTFDYVDDHFYIAHPHFLENPWRLPSKHDAETPLWNGGIHNAFTRLYGKPFTLTEFNYAAPLATRGAGGLMTGALAALQDWDGLWRFAYSHSRDNLFAPRPTGYFDLVTDPLNQAAERAALCLFRRGDLTPAPHRTAITFTPDGLQTAPARNLAPSWKGLAWFTRVGVEVLPAGAASKADLSLPYRPDADPYAEKAEAQVTAAYLQRGWIKKAVDTTKVVVNSETREIHIDAGDFVSVHTPNTMGCYSPPEMGVIDPEVLRITVSKAPATVWVSSLDGKPIKESGHLLITHLTDLQNTGAQFNDRARTVLTAWGTLPYLVHAGTAEVDLFLSPKKQVRVWGLSPGGRRLSEVPCKTEEQPPHGRYVKIPLDINAGGRARMLYEVEIK